MYRSRGKATWTLVAVALLVATAGGVTGAVAPLAVHAEDEAPSQGVTLSLSSAQRVVVALTTPTFEIENVWIDGRPYAAVSAPGLDDASPPGRPCLPSTGVLVGLPQAGEWSVRVVAEESERLPLSHPLLPAAEPITPLPGAGWEDQVPGHLVADAQTYDVTSWYPASPVEVGEVAIVRDLRVVPLRLYPFRYHRALGQIEIIRSLVVEISFEGGEAVGAPVQDEWDSVLQGAVINYDVARAWRGARASPAVGASNGAARAAGSFKVELKDDGIYELDYAALEAAGFPVDSVDPRDVHLSVRGQEIAIRIEGEGDGTFDPGDRILFYGQAASGRYTRRNVYWLTHDSTRGRRMAEQAAAPTDTYAVPQAHRATLHLEENHLYDPTHPEADGDHWYWVDLGFLQVECPVATQTFAFQLPHRWSGSHSIDLHTSLQGYTPGTHNLAVAINDQSIGNLIWPDQTRLDSVISFNSALLAAGENELRLENGDCPPPPPPSPPPNGMSFNYFEVSYLAEYQATNDSLDFWGNAGDWQYEIDGFSTADIMLFDITDDGAPTLLVDGRVEAGTRIEFEASTQQARRYLAVAGAAVRPPAALYPDVPSNLAATSNQADYLLIGYGEFLPAAQPLVDLRTGQGLRVMSIDVQDVYDEFNHGVMNPQAIRDLLGHVLAAWQPPLPTYVLLLGDGTIDFLDHLGNGWHNFVPAYPAKVDPYLGETATDNRLAAVAGDDILPDLHIGRLPVASTAQTTAVVNKIVSYETTPWPGWWARQMLFVADDADLGGDFVTLTDALYDGTVVAPFRGNRVYLVAGAEEGHEYDPADAAEVERARTAVSAYLGYGQLLVTYFGHASHSQWAQEILLHRDDVPGLGNGGRLPVVLSMTCYTGSFHHPPYAPLDERLVMEPGGGAVAAWGPTSSALLAGHYLLAQGFLQVVFSGGDRSLGAATLAGKANVYAGSPASRYLVDTYALLGDPATSLYLTPNDPHAVYLPSIYDHTVSSQ
ncbi:MAG: hypothetical protein JXA93_10750 [Anaerolineae bacterium]|nr:hypothetical protein [Anaerolineae bacterium]